MPEQIFKVRDLRQKTQFIIDDLYLNDYAKLMSPFASLVYMSLCRHADKKQGAFPSMRKMAEEFNVSQKSIKKGVKELVYWNIVKKQRIGNRLSNHYWLLDKSEWRPKELGAIAPIEPSLKKSDGFVGTEVMGTVEPNDGSIRASKDAQVKDSNKKDGYKNFLMAKTRLSNKFNFK